MRNLTIFLLVGFFAMTAASCGSDSPSDNSTNTAGDASGSVTESPASSISPAAPALPDAAPAAPAPAAASASAGSVQHYTCPNNCKGSGGAEKGNCPVCGTAYVHNQAFHAQTPGSTPNISASPTPAPKPEPAQNAAGVWHYTCGKGCAGGAGAAGNCATCGGPLAHNSAYHQ